MAYRSSPHEWDAAAMLDVLSELVNRYRLSDLTILYCNAAWAAKAVICWVRAISWSS